MALARMRFVESSHLSCRRPRGRDPEPASVGSWVAHLTRSLSWRASRLAEQTRVRLQARQAPCAARGVRTFRKEAVFVQDGKRVQEQQRSHEQVEQGHTVDSCEAASTYRAKLPAQLQQRPCGARNMWPKLTVLVGPNRSAIRVRLECE